MPVSVMPKSTAECKAKEDPELVLQTAPFDPRFPNQNQTK